MGQLGLRKIRPENYGRDKSFCLADSLPWVKVGNLPPNLLSKSKENFNILLCDDHFNQGLS